MKRPPVVVAIRELRLHGFDSRKRSRIGEAVKREVASVFRESDAALTPSREIIAEAVSSSIRRAVGTPC
jgi:hypothetical protein